jgi:hypothetical protein
VTRIGNSFEVFGVSRRSIMTSRPHGLFRQPGPSGIARSPRDGHSAETRLVRFQYDLNARHRVSPVVSVPSSRIIRLRNPEVHRLDLARTPSPEKRRPSSDSPGLRRRRNAGLIQIKAISAERRQ